ncbi:pentatricopeptide repeat-containing protein At4g21705, mitochondrial [Aegilops tauschii subsp. strangulata]|nr:pentatricopeptide repeat-containing protein At4g21705, mitochondrial [Aegilops tauschii subsp. strangulata]XP_044449414.1 pentatricopeptide repeat-containing protein At4g21705, mitochondrial-like [Triticum aestivum]
MASSSLFAAGRRLLHLGRGRLLQGRVRPHNPTPLLLPVRAASSPPSNSAERPPRRPPGLQSTLWPLGHPDTLLVPEIERWAEKPGNRLRPVELERIVKELRKRRRHRQALEVSEWMSAKGHVRFLPKDHAVHLDLIGQVQGIGAAEAYFNQLPDDDKTEKPYGALLNCYTRELMVDESLAHFQKMKEQGFVFCSLPYNNLMGLYTNIGQHEKVPSVIAEMKRSGIMPDNFSYRICINSYGRRADFFGMENTLEDMECEPQIVVDWNTYAVVASNYIKGNLREKAISALKKAEAKIDIKDSDNYNHLISLYGQLGDKSEVKRLWALQMTNCKRHINKDYTTMLAMLVRLDDFEEAEVLLKEWESSENAFDFHVPNVLLTGYRQKDMLDKAEALLDDFLKKGKMPPSSSWAIVAIGYAEKGDAVKAYELTKNALCVYAPRSGWIPRPAMIEMILKYLGDEGDLKDVETFVQLLQAAIPMNSDMTDALSRARMREEKKAGDAEKEALSSTKASG